MPSSNRTPPPPGTKRLGADRYPSYVHHTVSADRATDVMRKAYQRLPGHLKVAEQLTRTIFEGLVLMQSQGASARLRACKLPKV
jgi:hypothetical protein